MCSMHPGRGISYGVQDFSHCERTSSMPTLDGTGMGSGRELGKKQSFDTVDSTSPLGFLISSSFSVTLLLSASPVTSRTFSLSFLTLLLFFQLPV